MRRFGWWLGAATVSLIGTQVMGFAMTWVAASRGGVWAGLVLTGIVLPRALLLLVGGAVADRIGAWRVMITADVAMAGVTLVLALVVWRATDHPAVLVVAALIMGVADAFYLPSSGSMPRRLVAPEQLTRATSARLMAGQLAGFVGPAIGGVTVAVAGLAQVAAVNATTFLGMAAVLVGLRPRSKVRQSTVRQSTGEKGEMRTATGVGAQVRDGLRVVLGDRSLLRALALTAAAAALLLPVTSLLIPILARQRHWPPAHAGLTAGMIALASASVAMVVLTTNRRPDPVYGLLLAATAVIALGSFESPRVALVAAALTGTGVGMFGTSLAPLVLARAPTTHLARVQAIVAWVQSVPLLVAHPVLGALTDEVGAAGVLVGCAVVLTAAIFVIGPV